MENFKFCKIKRVGKATDLSKYSLAEAKKVEAFHKNINGYEPTPLVSLSKLAEYLGVKGICIKDESYRFGLNAFKALGGSYCIHRILEKRRAAGIEEKPVFVTATDGNHGRGVAWAATREGCKSIVYMPRGSAQERLDNIKKAGAEAYILDMIYDNVVRFAAKQAEEKGWILVQDTAWEGYEEYPELIMQGYLTMGLEAVRQLGDVKPTHLFLQAGVGSMTGSLAAFFASYYGEERPLTITVEPSAADCMYETALAADGRLHATKGNLKTIMAGLACGEPCLLAWDLLKDYADYAVSMPDEIAAKGMRMLANPLPGDTRIISGESGASCAGLAFSALEIPSLAKFKEEIGLDENSVVLCYSTEGATDRQNYLDIVWDGKHPSEK